MKTYFKGLLIVLLILGCSPKSEFREIYGNAFGTTYSIKAFTELTDESLQKQVDELVQNVNASISTYDPTSLISRVNRGDTALIADAYFTQVLALSRQVNAQTDGFFDPTVGILVNALGFGPIKINDLPNNQALDSLCQFVGLQQVKIAPDGAISKNHPSVYLDFNAIGKGYGIDVIGIALEELGIANYLIEIGGEVRAKGLNIRKNQSWLIGIESPEVNGDGRRIDKVLEITDQSMASSGNYRKFKEDARTGRKYVHTVNPRRCRAEENAITSATVIAATCAEADAYATAIMAMGLERTKQLLSERPDLQVYFTYHDQANEPRWYATPNLLDRLKQ